MKSFFPKLMGAAVLLLGLSSGLWAEGTETEAPAPPPNCPRAEGQAPAMHDPKAQPMAGCAGMHGAQPGMKPGMMGPHGSGMMGSGMQGHGGAKMAHHHLYDPQTVTTVSGEIVRVEAMNPMPQRAPGLHLTLKTAEGELDVHLGPQSYLEKQEVKLAAQAQVQVTGSKIDLQGRPTLIATEVKTENGVLKLRNEKGFPLWAASKSSQ